MLKECRTVLLGQQIKVFTDHKNLVCEHFNTERVMSWCLLLEEFGLQLTCIKGPHNVVADALSCMEISEDKFSAEAFAASDEMSDFPTEFPLSHHEIAARQEKDKSLQKKFRDNPEDFAMSTFEQGDRECSLIMRNDKIVIPKSMQQKVTKWHHLHLLHPGETRMELTIGQHCHWDGMHNTIKRCTRGCAICKTNKPKKVKHRKLVPKTPESIPWHTLCVDLVGPCTFGEGKNEFHLHCLTMIDPTTGWFEIAKIPNKRADCIANILEFTWLTRCPWPTEIVMDRGKEFAAEVREALKHECSIHRKIITTRNPQANSMIE